MGAGWPYVLINYQGVNNLSMISVGNSISHLATYKSGCVRGKREAGFLASCGV